MIARATGVLVAASLTVVVLAGCVLGEGASPTLLVVNEYPGAVDVVYQGEDGPVESRGDAGERWEAALAECRGDSFEIRAVVDGALLATVDQPLCPDEELTVHTDGSVTYSRDE